jgi:alpha-galactosidase
MEALAMVLPTGNVRVTDAVVRSEPAPGVRYVNGPVVYEEALVDGRWVGRYWSSNGRIRPDIFVSGANHERVKNLPIEAFELEIDGQTLNSGWQWVGARIEANSEGPRTVVVELDHSVRPIVLSIHTLLDGTAVLTRWLEIRNRGERPAALARVQPFAGLLWRMEHVRDHLSPEHPHAFTRGAFQSATHLNEGCFTWEPVPNGCIRLEGRRGRSGHRAPFFIVRNEANGEHVIAHIAYSANWSYELIGELDPASADASLCFRAGPAGVSPLRVIDPQEAVETPAVHLGLVYGDLDETIQAMHDHIRLSVAPPQPEGRAQRFTHNHWGFVTDRVNEEFLRRDIDVAAETGAELYILDAGWFGTEPGRWYHTVGDWWAGKWLPNGVRAIREYAREKGLLFGMWMEAECVGSLSQLYREHPDWIMRRDGNPVVQGRAGEEHFILDLTKSHVAAWFEAEINRVVEEFDLDLFRLDYNIDAWEGGHALRSGFVENTLWRYYEVLYGTFDRLRARFPRLILENCSSGGGRADLGMMARFHTTQISDLAQLPRALAVLNGMTMALPPELCHPLGGYMNGEELFYGDVDTQFRATLFGHPMMIGSAPSLSEMVPGFGTSLKRHIEIYQTYIRPILGTSRVFHHTPVIDFRNPRGFCALEYAAPDGDSAVAGIFRLAGPGPSTYHFRPKGLDRGRRYNVLFDNSRENVEASGLTLANDGLRIGLESPLTSELLIFERR